MDPIQDTALKKYFEGRLKILQICASYKPAFVYGGPTMSVAMLSEELTKEGISVVVYTTTANGAAELPVPTGTPVNVDGVNVYYFKRWTKDHSHFSPALFKQLWSHGKEFDIVHIHAWWNLVSIISCLICVLKKLPVTVSPRGTLSAYSFLHRHTVIKAFFHETAGKFLLNRSHVHVTAWNEQCALQKIARPKSITELPNLVKLPVNMPPVCQNDPEAFRIIFLSRIDEKKGLDLLLMALKNIEVPYRLTIAGTGDEAYIQRLKSLLPTEGIVNVTWAGYQAQDKFALLSAHDLFVLPSYDENFGNAVAESLSMGTAVLVSQEVGLADFVSQFDLGWICRPDTGSISAAINRIAQSEAPRLAEIRKVAPAVIRENFQGSPLTKRYIEMYYQISQS